MRYGSPLTSGASSARAANTLMELPGCAMHAPAAGDWAHSRSHRPRTRVADGGTGLGHARQTVVVVTDAQQRTEQHGRRDADQPHSEENQPEGHTLPVVALGKLNSMRHRPQDAALVSSRTLRRNPARLSVETAGWSGPNPRTEPVRRGTKPCNLTAWDWTERSFWVSSIPRASWTPCSRRREVPDAAPLTYWKGDPAFTKRRSAAIRESRGCL